MGRHRMFSDQDYLDALRAFFAKHRRAPWAKEMRGMAYGVPSLSSLKQRFGSVRRAMLAAGVPPNREGGCRRHGRRMALVPIDPEKAEALTRAKRDYWQSVERGKHGLSGWVHPYARRSA